MNLDYYIRKKHIFKNRQKTSYCFFKFNKGCYNYIYTPQKVRIDFVFLRLLKKLFRRKFIKAKMRFFKPKFWFLIMPNYILTQKSKNSRMGAGVGRFIRLTNITYSGKSIVKTWYYTTKYLNSIIKYLRYKCTQKFLLKKCYK